MRYPPSVTVGTEKGGTVTRDQSDSQPIKGTARSTRVDDRKRPRQGRRSCAKETVSVLLESPVGPTQGGGGRKD